MRPRRNVLAQDIGNKWEERFRRGSWLAMAKMAELSTTTTREQMQSDPAPSDKADKAADNTATDEAAAKRKRLYRCLTVIGSSFTAVALILLCVYFDYVTDVLIATIGIVAILTIALVSQTDLQKLMLALSAHWYNRLPGPIVAYPAIFLIGSLMIYILLREVKDIYTSGPFFLALKEIGFAFIVASVIASTIEVYNLRRHRLASKELKADVFGAVYENRLTPSVFSATRTHILSSSFISTRLNIHVVITPSEIVGQVEVIVRMDRIVKNVSGSSAPYPFKSSFLHSAGSSSPYETKFLCLLIDKAAQDLVLAGGKSNDGAAYVGSTIDLAPDASTSICVEGQLRMDGADRLPLLTKLPADRMTITLKAPSNIEVHLRGLYAGEIEHEARCSRELDRVWHVRGGLFPGNGVILSWRLAS
jgi:hypothetical protein